MDIKSIDFFNAMTKSKETTQVQVEPMDERKVGINDSLSATLSRFRDLDDGPGTRRGLKSRHIQLIALGGAIGTGLFVGSGGGLATSGPAGLLVGYLVVALFVWFIMNMMSEMVTLLPLPGEGTLYAMSRRYVGRSFSFTTGWNIYYAQAMIPPTEITACAFVIEYWSSANPAIWISIFLVITILINVLPVNFFGESEFYVCIIKILCITGLIILGIVIFFGGGPKQHGVLGFKYWKDPGAFVDHLVPGSTGKFLACWTGIIKAGFAFILSPELITSCSLEAEYPRRNLPIVCRRFIYRLFVFYILGVLVIGVIVASDDDGLMGAIKSGSSSAKASPFVIGMTNVGIHTLPHIINACILTSAYSCGAGMLYGASRGLYSMALQGDAPKVFAKTNRWGVPIYAVAVSALFNFLAYLNCSNSASQVFSWLSNIATIAGFISWMFVAITYIRYRKVIEYHNLTDRVPYRPPLQMIGAYSAAIFFFILTLTNGYAVFIKGNWDTSNFFSSYITLLVVVVIYITSLTLFKEWGKWQKHPSEVYMLDVLELADAEEEEHKAEFDAKMETRNGFGWKIFYSIL